MERDLVHGWVGGVDLLDRRIAPLGIGGGVREKLLCLT